MISQDVVWDEIWPVVEGLIQATLAEDEAGVKKTLDPKGQAAEMYDLYGRHIFDILLKTVLGRGSLSVTRAIETEQGKFVHIEFAWPDPEAENGGYTAADVVSVKLRRYRKAWRVVEVNPATADLPLTEARAAGILVTSKAFSSEGGVPSEAWILPIALFGGALQIHLREEGLKDDVERLFLPELQKRGYGVLSQLGARRLWRDFRKKGKIFFQSDDVKHWAAAVEFIANQQAMREESQAAVAKHYQAKFTTLSSCVRQIKQTLRLGDDLDERYTAVQREQIVLNSKG